jgi:hypothetical protein
VVFSPDAFWPGGVFFVLSFARYGGGKSKANLSRATRKRDWWGVGRGKGREVCSGCLYKRERDMLDSEDARATIVVYTHLLRKLGRELGGMPLVQSNGNLVLCAPVAMRKQQEARCWLCH